MGRLKMKNRRWCRAARSQNFIERSVRRNRVVHAHKIDAAPAKGIRIAGYQLPVVLFAAKAKNGHAQAMKRKEISKRGPVQSASNRQSLLRLLGSYDFPKDVVQRLRQLPLRI